MNKIAKNICYSERERRNLKNEKIVKVGFHPDPEKNSAITLIALVITIIVLLIIAGITLTFVLGENGIFSKAKKAKEDNEKAQAVEDVKLRIIEAQMEANAELRKASLKDLYDVLKRATEEYEVKTSQISSLVNSDEYIESISKLYIRNTKYSYVVEVNSDLKIQNDLTTAIASTNSSNSESTSQTGGNTAFGGCSRYTKVTVTKAYGGNATLSVNIPEEDRISAIHYYINNNEVYVGTEKTYTVTGLEIGESYKASAIIEYNNIKEEESFICNSVPDADIYVSKGGNDETGDGSANNPYETLSKAIDSASSGNSIYICPGTYNLTAMASTEPTYAQVGISDQNKELTIFGANEETRLIWNGSDSSVRDGNAVELRNGGTVLRNLIVEFYAGKSASYSNAICRKTYGTIFNVYFELHGSASFMYHNSQGDSNILENCVFHFNNAKVGSYNGKATYTNIVSTYKPDGGTIDSNSIIKSFNNLNDIKTDEDIINAEVGVYFGTYAWK